MREKTDCCLKCGTEGSSYNASFLKKDFERELYLELDQVMFSLTNRLVHAKQASEPCVYHEEDEVKAGRDAEKELVRALEKSGVPTKHIFCGLRVSDNFQTRKYEIDVVVLSELGIFTFEVKNWSGEVVVSPDKKNWIQKKQDHQNNKNAKVTYEINHDNALNGLLLKTQLLRTHLLKCEVCLAQKFFKPRVVFMNKNVKLSPMIENSEEVLTFEKLTKFLESMRWSLAGWMANSLVPGFITGQLSYGNIEGARQVLSAIGTWDVIHLNGGQQLVGDFKGCAHFSPNRNEMGTLEFSHQRNATLGTFWALLGYTPVVSVKMEKRRNDSWIWNSSCGVVNIPYNADINFRIAGEKSDAKIPANDIRSIILSI